MVVGRDLPRPGSMTRCGTRVCVVGKVRTDASVAERKGSGGAGRLFRAVEARLGPNLTIANRRSPTDVVTSAVRGWPH